MKRSGRRELIIWGGVCYSLVAICNPACIPEWRLRGEARVRVMAHGTYCLPSEQCGHGQATALGSDNSSGLGKTSWGPVSYYLYLRSRQLHHMTGTSDGALGPCQNEREIKEVSTHSN